MSEGAACPDGCGPLGIPQCTHSRAAELQDAEEPNALICAACGYKWVSHDARQVGKAWRAEYQEVTAR